MINIANLQNTLHNSVSLEEATRKRAAALAPQGTRLLVLDRIEQDGEVLRAYIQETVCSAGEPQGSGRKCTFTLGAVWGALAQLAGHRLQGNHTESVLRGGQYDVFEFTKLG